MSFQDTRSEKLQEWKTDDLVKFTGAVYNRNTFGESVKDAEIRFGEGLGIAEWRILKRFSVVFNNPNGQCSHDRRKTKCINCLSIASGKRLCGLGDWNTQVLAGVQTEKFLQLKRCSKDFDFQTSL